MGEYLVSVINGDIKRSLAVIDHLRATLCSTSPAENIDSRIRQAELEFQIEAEETKVLLLQDKKQRLKFSDDSYQSVSSRVRVTLYQIISSYSRAASLFTHSLVYRQEAPEFILQQDSTEVQTTAPSSVLKTGDRIVEINGLLVICVQDVGSMLTSGRMELVLLRRTNAEDELKGQVERLTRRHEKLLGEKDALKSDNLRLAHRVSLLEDRLARLAQHQQRNNDIRQQKQQKVGRIKARSVQDIRSAFSKLVEPPSPTPAPAGNHRRAINSWTETQKTNHLKCVKSTRPVTHERSGQSLISTGTVEKVLTKPHRHPGNNTADPFLPHDGLFQMKRASSLQFVATMQPTPSINNLAEQHHHRPLRLQPSRSAVSIMVVDNVNCS